MRIHLFIAVAALLAAGAGCSADEVPPPGATVASPSAAEAGARISFSELEHDFGIVFAGDRAQHVFKFKNTGSAELEVISAQGT
jgi:hypothetical protein